MNFIQPKIDHFLWQLQQAFTLADVYSEFSRRDPEKWVCHCANLGDFLRGLATEADEILARKKELAEPNKRITKDGE